MNLGQKWQRRKEEQQAMGGDGKTHRKSSAKRISQDRDGAVSGEHVAVLHHLWDIAFLAEYSHSEESQLM